MTAFRLSSFARMPLMDKELPTEVVPAPSPGTSVLGGLVRESLVTDKGRPGGAPMLSAKQRALKVKRVVEGVAAKTRRQSKQVESVEGYPSPFMPDGAAPGWDTWEPEPLEKTELDEFRLLSGIYSGTGFPKPITAGDRRAPSGHGLGILDPHEDE